MNSCCYIHLSNIATLFQIVQDHSYQGWLRVFIGNDYKCKIGMLNLLLMESLVHLNDCKRKRMRNVWWESNSIVCQTSVKSLTLSSCSHYVPWRLSLRSLGTGLMYFTSLMDFTSTCVHHLIFSTSQPWIIFMDTRMGAIIRTYPHLSKLDILTLWYLDVHRISKCWAMAKFWPFIHCHVTYPKIHVSLIVAFPD